MTKNKTSFVKGNKASKGAGGQPRIYDDEYIKALIPNLLEWADKEDSIVFNEWIAGVGHHQEEMHVFCHRCPEFAKIYRDCKLKIAGRRERLAIKGEVCEGIVKSTLFVYDKEHFDALLAMKKATAEAAGPQTVNVYTNGRADARKTLKRKRKAK